MQVGHIEGATRVLGKSQGYLGLPIRDDVTDAGSPKMVTAWFPTPAELAAIVAGAPIYVHVLGCVHPPIRLDVGAVPV